MALQAPRMVATLAWSRDGRFIALGDIDDESLSKGGIQGSTPYRRAAIISPIQDRCRQGVWCLRVMPGWSSLLSVATCERGVAAVR